MTGLLVAASRIPDEHWTWVSFGVMLSLVSSLWPISRYLEWRDEDRAWRVARAKLRHPSAGNDRVRR